MNEDWPDSAPTFWAALASREPGQVCARSGAVLAGARFRLGCLHETWLVDASARTVEKEAGEPADEWDRRMPFLILAYLASASEADLTGEMVPPRDLVPGQDFFQGHNAIETAGLEEAFGSDAGALLRASLRLGAQQAAQADACARLHVFPKLPVDVLLWIADEEFPAKVTILLDRGTPRHYPVEGVAISVNLLTRRLIAAGKEER